MREDKSVRQLMTVNDVAVALNVSKRAVEHMIARSQIQVVNINSGLLRDDGTPMQRCIRIWPNDLEKFIQERREQRTNRGGRR